MNRSIEECREFCKLINLRDSMNQFKGRGTKYIEKILGTVLTYLHEENKEGSK